MPLLEALLALALTMLSLAMLATFLVEGVHRFTQTRAADLQRMLDQFYDAELAPIVKAELKGAGANLDAKKVQLLKVLQENPLLASSPAGVRDKLRSIFKPLARLSTEDMLKQLAKSELGVRIKQKAEVEIDEFVHSVTLAYDAFGAAASDLFRRRARAWSLIAGVLVAVCLNVNAVTLFQRYMSDPNLRAEAVAQAEDITKRFEDRVDKSDEAFKETTEIDDYVTTMRGEVASLKKMGVVFGYQADAAPRVIWRKATKANPNVRGRPQAVFETLLWLVGVVVTGLLIGQGGPFWFDVVRKLTNVLQVVRGGASPAADEAGGDAVTDATVVQAQKDIFKLAGGGPPAVKAKAKLDAAAQAAAQADVTAQAAAATLRETQQAVQAGGPASAVGGAEQAFQMATDAQNTMHQMHWEAVQAFKDAHDS